MVTLSMFVHIGLSESSKCTAEDITGILFSQLTNIFIKHISNVRQKLSSVSCYVYAHRYLLPGLGKGGAHSCLCMTT
jgi:hypothetical protein